MKRLLIVVTMIACLTPTLTALDMPYYLYDYKGVLNRLNLVNTVQDIYVKLGNCVDLSSTQNVGGAKTFTQPIVYPDSTSQSTAYIKYTSTTCVGISWNTSGTGWNTITGSTLTLVCDGNTYVEYIIDLQGSGTGAAADDGIRLYMDNILQFTRYVDNSAPTIVYTNLSRSGLTSIKPSAGTHKFYLMGLASVGTVTVTGGYTLRPSY